MPVLKPENRRRRGVEQETWNFGNDDHFCTTFYGSERESVNPGDFIDFLRVGIFRYTRRDAKY